MSATRNDLPVIVEPDLESIASALADLEGDLRRMGLGIQADKASATRAALRQHRERHEICKAFAFA